jgi:hypothetical protein
MLGASGRFARSADALARELGRRCAESASFSARVAPFLSPDHGIGAYAHSACSRPGSATAGARAANCVKIKRSHGILWPLCATIDPVSHTGSKTPTE